MGEAHISRQVQARPIRVMLVDDHEVVRRGLRSLLEPAADILICGETGGVSEAVEAVQSMDPDVVIMDVGLPDGSGIDAARQIRVRLPSTRVVIFTSFADPEALFASILAGASGFLLKQIEGGSLVSAIRMVAQGRRVLDPSIMEAALDRLRQYLVEDEKLARLS
ncbi:MAG: response regulator, partial [Actinomycetota bacterium]